MWRDRLPGGKADRRRPEQFDRRQLAIGQRVEMEHTSDPAVAIEIAMDHLTEDPDYYRKLATIHLDGPMRYKNVGIAPGTTTLHIGPTDGVNGDLRAIPSAMQMSIESGANPIFTPAGAPHEITPQWASLGTVRPTDFEKAKIYGYLPVTTGWLPGHLSDGTPGPITSAEGAWASATAVEKGAVVLGGGLTVLGAILALMNKRRFSKIALGLGATGGTILLGYAGSHMVRARQMIADPNIDAQTAPVVFDRESKLEAFDLIAGGVMLSGVITGLMMLPD